MSEGVLITIITAGQAIVLALLGIVATRLGKVRTTVGAVQTDVARVKADASAARTNSAAARVQVENDHSTNMREENDERHRETKRWIDDLRATFTGEIRVLRKEVGADIGGIRQELRDDRRANRDAISDLSGRITSIEQKES
ncbi:hypothetical protein FVO59_12045 [Microbacterium esteraromaticum]|uniref:DUF2746 domain-containing protein n=1 Tax=Microbacterium esteraromaticum TaxID=57043 RepID=A0A7D7WF38_9MICO|nr:hypothetical protein [Microbacterium esteraromaticum]QMU97857.1 hypothetical protein FVO59_12045 [Microbacterium esteraromaticum]